MVLSSYKLFFYNFQKVFGRSIFLHSVFILSYEMFYLILLLNKIFIVIHAWMFITHYLERSANNIHDFYLIKINFNFNILLCNISTNEHSYFRFKETIIRKNSMVSPKIYSMSYTSHNLLIP